MLPDRAILIAGGGIGGLAAALALAQHGLRSCILEQSAVSGEVGAGIQIGPNGTRLLDGLGVLPALQRRTARPEGLLVFDGPSGALLTRLPLGTWMSARHGADYLAAHRADLHGALMEAVSRNGRIETRHGFRVARIEDDAQRGVRVWGESGGSADGAALIGADGVWSTVRREVFGRTALRATGKTASRTLIPMADVSPPFTGPVVGVWMGRRAHVVHYPVRAGTLLAVIAVVDDDWTGEGWGHATDAAQLLDRFSGWSDAVPRLLARAPGWRKWALFDPPPLPCWSRGRVALLGDAAHPVLPFLAQGAVLALEDAAVLAAALARAPGGVASALQAYEQARRSRAARVQAAARRNGWIYHLGGAARLARNFVLRTVPGARVMAGYDWLYGWKSAESKSG